MPIQAPQWTEFLSCPVCYNVFNETHYRPISLACGHTVCRSCLSKFQQRKCPFDQSLITRDVEDLPVNFALLQLVSATAMPDNRKGCVPEEYKRYYESAKSCVEELALLLKPVSSSTTGSIISAQPPTNGACPNSPSCVLSRPMQRKLITLVNCQLVEEEGRARALRAARSLGERTVTELILQHQNPQQLSSNLWAAVRGRGCQFLGPGMQEEVLKLILLALEDGSALSRKVLVLFVVQRLEAQYPQASKTAIGHVVQLLYRASCFKVTKRDEESSLMQLKEEYRTYEMLRREHDSQIVQIAMEAGLRIAPDQWSSLLYGDSTHKSHMQSIIDKLQTPQTFSQSVSELLIALQRTGDPHNLQKLRPELEFLSSIDPSPDVPSPSWENMEGVMKAVKTVVEGLVYFLQNSGTKKHDFLTPFNVRYKTSLCRDYADRGICPRGTSCTFAHSEDELERYRQRNKRAAKGLSHNKGDDWCDGGLRDVCDRPDFSRDIKSVPISTKKSSTYSQLMMAVPPHQRNQVVPHVDGMNQPPANVNMLVPPPGNVGPPSRNVLPNNGEMNVLTQGMVPPPINMAPPIGNAGHPIGGYVVETLLSVSPQGNVEELPNGDTAILQVGNVVPPSGMMGQSTVNMAPPTGIMGQPTGNMAPPTVIMGQPTGNMAPPTGIMGQPTDNMAPPRGIMGQPTGNMAPPTGIMGQPTGNMAPPTGNMVPPTGNMGLPTGNMAPPTGNMALPTGNMMAQPTGNMVMTPVMSQSGVPAQGGISMCGPPGLPPPGSAQGMAPNMAPIQGMIPPYGTAGTGMPGPCFPMHPTMMYGQYPYPHMHPCMPPYGYPQGYMAPDNSRMQYDNYYTSLNPYAEPWNPTSGHAMPYQEQYRGMQNDNCSVCNQRQQEEQRQQHFQQHQNLPQVHQQCQHHNDIQQQQGGIGQVQQGQGQQQGHQQQGQQQGQIRPPQQQHQTGEKKPYTQQATPPQQPTHQKQQQGPTPIATHSESKQLEQNYRQLNYEQQVGNKPNPPQQQQRQQQKQAQILQEKHNVKDQNEPRAVQKQQPMKYPTNQDVQSKTREVESPRAESDLPGLKVITEPAVKLHRQFLSNLKERRKSLLAQLQELHNEVEAQELEKCEPIIEDLPNLFRYDALDAIDSGVQPSTVKTSKALETIPALLESSMPPTGMIFERLGAISGIPPLGIPPQSVTDSLLASWTTSAFSNSNKNADYVKDQQVVWMKDTHVSSSPASRREMQYGRNTKAKEKKTSDNSWANMTEEDFPYWKDVTESLDSPPATPTMSTSSPMPSNSYLTRHKSTSGNFVSKSSTGSEVCHVSDSYEGSRSSSYSTSYSPNHSPVLSSKYPKSSNYVDLASELRSTSSSYGTNASSSSFSAPSYSAALCTAPSNKASRSYGASSSYNDTMTYTNTPSYSAQSSNGTSSILNDSTSYTITSSPSAPSSYKAPKSSYDASSYTPPATYWAGSSYNSLTSSSSEFQTSSYSPPSFFEYTNNSCTGEDHIPFVEGSPTISKFGPISRWLRTNGKNVELIKATADEMMKTDSVTAVTPLQGSPLPNAQTVPSRFTQSEDGLFTIPKSMAPPTEMFERSYSMWKSEVNLLEQKAKDANTEDQKLNIKLQAVEMQITLKQQQLQQASVVEQALSQASEYMKRHHQEDVKKSEESKTNPTR